MSDSSKAVFLSYASQDAEAARRICDALRAAGVEVWFDQSELRGGDTWDHKIRKQIKECALFVPIISANTNSRPEGYFRLEWKLAVDRSHLLADDHPSNRLVIELMLGPFGVRIQSVGDGEAAISAFLAETPGCVLMDMQMPIMDGLEATRRIRAHEENLGLPRTPIIMVTANALEVHQNAAISAGVDLVLTKPVGLRALVSAIESLL